MTINRLKKILLLLWCTVVWYLAVQVFGEQERMALFHCLAVVILSLLVVWIMEKVGISIVNVLEKCGVSCLKKERDFREDIEETLYCVQKMVPRNEMNLRMIK